MFAEKSATLNLHSILLLLDGVNGSYTYICPLSSFSLTLCSWEGSM